MCTSPLTVTCRSLAYRTVRDCHSLVLLGQCREGVQTDLKHGGATAWCGKLAHTHTHELVCKLKLVQLTFSGNASCRSKSPHCMMSCKPNGFAVAPRSSATVNVPLLQSVCTSVYVNVCVGISFLLLRHLSDVDVAQGQHSDAAQCFPTPVPWCPLLNLIRKLST